MWGGGGGVLDLNTYPGHQYEGILLMCVCVCVCVWGGGGILDLNTYPGHQYEGALLMWGGGGDIVFKHIPRAPIRGYSPNVGGILDLNTYPGRLYEGALLLEDIGFVYVIAWLGVKFGINFTSVVVRMAKNCTRRSRVQFCHSHYNTSEIYPKISLLAML